VTTHGIAAGVTLFVIVNWVMFVSGEELAIIVRVNLALWPMVGAAFALSYFLSG
jgi:hypothetical protein